MISWLNGNQVNRKVEASYLYFGIKNKKKTSPNHLFLRMKEKVLPKSIFLASSLSTYKQLTKGKDLNLTESSWLYLLNKNIKRSKRVCLSTIKPTRSMIALMTFLR